MLGEILSTIASGMNPFFSKNIFYNEFFSVCSLFILDDWQFVRPLLSQDLLSRLFLFMKIRQPTRFRLSQTATESVDIYWIRNLIEIRLHSEGSEYQGGYVDSEFAS